MEENIASIFRISEKSYQEISRGKRQTEPFNIPLAFA
jgi:hypothetical protein